MSGITTPTKRQPAGARAAAGAAKWADDRFHMAGGIRKQLNKVFPTHWSFLLGEIALYSFIILLLSGTYLALFFDPSMQEVTYNGSFVNLQGIEMSRAFESTLNINFEVRGGLFVRQVHHWAALLFMAAIVVHMFRIFFTGAFRRPREINWVIGILLFMLGAIEGFLGYSLPDDLLSGTGLRVMAALLISFPVIGTWTNWLLFGGEFPGMDIIPRLYTLHILVVPAVILALIAVHLGLVWYQKHTQFPGVGRKETNVVGVRIMPVFAAKGGGFFAVVVAVTALMGGVFQINPIWNIGPYNAAQVSAGSQPDWYMGWTDGLVRLWPAWELYLGDYTVPAPFWPFILGLPLLTGIAAAYPWIERRMTKDYAHHNLLQRPRDVPVRTSLGMMAITYFMVMLLMGANDIIAFKFDISLNATTWMGRIGLLLLPPLAYFVTYRLCIGLQKADREVLEHGVETGIIKRLPHGEFIEVHQPLGPVDDHGHPVALEYQGAPVPKKMNKLGAAGHPVPGSFFTPDKPEETAALARARAAQGSGVGTLSAENKPADPSERGSANPKSVEGDRAGD
ncbi:cytochrome bc complex cytochrome b subunit [Actinosynnema pretiosum subsp. pretiosum]|uniref:Cytochrome bc1 complex cytochrome b subunit n=2 Tax=Actinosynnema TaxID=40566 RepID=C6W9G5_ACTMD|nr:cytochrome bc complex cytochrome b subunit [Actinosynnema mirum]ACU35328.1 cytochrome b/b6 domain protein [Actinosynnema mirum DSM 43827]AXX28700.1 Ubiquinol--cytochrome c reductase, cytochrome B subunit [Actinosynnema pretiosum subsp. pretiosum]QUF06977.1 cytochrome bc complex cytochrome b subunit [Actinosynnema pretiosum subsp. pretiosum]